MFVWQKRASAAWLAANEGALRGLRAASSPLFRNLGEKGTRRDCGKQPAQSEKYSLSFWREDFCRTGIKKFVIRASVEESRCEILKVTSTGSFDCASLPLG